MNYCEIGRCSKLVLRNIVSKSTQHSRAIAIVCSTVLRLTFIVSFVDVVVIVSVVIKLIAYTCAVIWDIIDIQYCQYCYMMMYSVVRSN